MTILTRVKKLTEVALHPSVVTGQSKYLFIFSHMRSRSSVLSHILGSNEGVCGYSELHRSYLSYMDVIKMRVSLYHDLKVDLTGKYLLDKVLHNEHEMSEDVLSALSPKVIFLLRRPGSTLKSIIDMGRMSGVEWYMNPGKASDYYCSRLARLTEYARIFEGNYFFIESDELVNNTDQVLSKLSRWLSLDDPLLNDYQFFSNTGKPGYGDRSKQIRAGKIVKTEGHSDISIPSDVLQTAEVAYEQCKASLLKPLRGGLSLVPPPS